MAAETDDYNEVLSLVRSWPAEQRATFVHDVLQTLGAEESSIRLRTPTLAHARGLLATNVDPPSDEDVARWLDEYRMQKYAVR